MKVQHYTATPAEPVPGAEGVTVRWVIKEADGAPHFAMRLFEVPPGGASELHTHWWEHEIYFLAGAGHIHGEQADHPVAEGTVAFVPGGELHQVVNDGPGVLRFICLVPHQRPG
ncbi:MAG TPA: cupin domain-containing protein [Anaerolineae bacterium]|nr:cupin domain-containing protein [Anaerolineae bacterium]HOQ98921.1 cupin domain-containing protein [Anaerolineae bacterium]HPL26517.1 cupin domain-containing protein [Anaerolineae bacterium]